MAIITYRLEYIPSVRHPEFYGSDKSKERKIRDRRMRLLYKDTFTYALSKNSDGIIEELTDGIVTRRICPKDFLYKHYGICRASEYAFNRLLHDITHGLVSFEELYKEYRV